MIGLLLLAWSGRLRGKLFGDRGYISAPLTHLLFEQGLQLITRLRKNMRESSHASFG